MTKKEARRQADREAREAERAAREARASKVGRGAASAWPTGLRSPALALRWCTASLGEGLAIAGGWPRACHGLRDLSSQGCMAPLPQVNVYEERRAAKEREREEKERQEVGVAGPVPAPGPAGLGQGRGALLAAAAA
jgi:hypothetical protein